LAAIATVPASSFLKTSNAQMKEHHREFLEALMGYERQCF